MADYPADLRALLERFVTESGNPGNSLGVSHVEVEVPSPLLQSGVVLIDTPGIGSTLRHNTEATVDFLPQCDAALFVVSADPPITEAELVFLRLVQPKVTRLFFVLNKADYLGTKELQHALGFLRSVLERHAQPGPDPVLFCVSARDGLRSVVEGDRTLWESSGLAELEGYLVRFLASERVAAVEEAVSRKAASVCDEASMRLGLRLRSLQMPLEDLQDRLDTFDAKLCEIDRERLVVGDGLSGDRERILAHLEEHCERLRLNASSRLDAVAERALSTDGSRSADEKALCDAVAAAVPGFFEQEMVGVVRLFDRMIADALERHWERIDSLIVAVRSAAAELFEIPYAAPDGSRASEFSSRPYWVTHSWASSMSPIPPGVMDRFVPRA
jgi:hypothetical protein